MSEFILIIIAAGIVYYVATRIAPHGLIFKLKAEEAGLRPKVAEKAPEEPKTVSLLEQGEELFNKGELEQAEKKFLSLLKEDPHCAEAFHFLGTIYLRQEMYEGAVDALEIACKLDPLNDTDFNNLGLSYHNLKNFTKAIENLEKSISLNDKIAHRHLNLALAYQEEKNYDRAAISLENAAKIHPNKDNLTLLAKNYFLMEDKKLAGKAIDRLLEIDPENAWAKKELAGLKN